MFCPVCGIKSLEFDARWAAVHDHTEVLDNSIKKQKLNHVCALRNLYTFHTNTKTALNERC